jgi:hypothetical protein
MGDANRSYRRHRQVATDGPTEALRAEPKGSSGEPRGLYIWQWPSAQEKGKLEFHHH